MAPKSLPAFVTSSSTIFPTLCAPADASGSRWTSRATSNARTRMDVCVARPIKCSPGRDEHGKSKGHTARRFRARARSISNSEILKTAHVVARRPFTPCARLAGCAGRGYPTRHSHLDVTPLRPWPLSASQGFPRASTTIVPPILTREGEAGTRYARSGWGDRDDELRGPLHGER